MNDFSKKGIVKFSIVGIFAFALFILTAFVFISDKSLAVLDKDNYILGEKVSIDLRGIDDYTIQIRTPSTKYIKRGSNDIFIFKPEENGKYNLIVENSKGRKEYSFFVGQAIEQNIQPNNITLNSTAMEILNDSDLINIDLILKPGKPSFSLSEDPTFNLARKDIETESSLVDRIKELFSNSNESLPELTYVSSEIRNSNGEVMPLETIYENNSLKINRVKSLKPGKYFLKTIFLDGNGDTTTIENDFLWGVLAINTDKSIYLENEEAFIGMAILDDLGRMVCNADVILEITSPNGRKTVLSTEEGSITISDSCRISGVTNLPDYYTEYETGQTGIYLMNLTAYTNNGMRNILDSFEVRNNLPFDIKRTGPTRLYPAQPYEMNITIKANEDYSGIVEEKVPALFDIEGAQTRIEGDTKILTWKAEFTAGETYQFLYEFDAPDQSPDLFFLGPLRIGHFEERRQWQMANDAVYNGELYLFYNGTDDAPNGWECVSCNTGDDFFGRFVRGAGTYGGTGGTTTHTHSMSLVLIGSGAGQAVDSQNQVSSAEFHTHSTLTSPSVSTESNYPAFSTLKVIRYNGTDIPSIIPQGAIAIFNTTDLPENWQRYSALDGRFALANATSNTNGGSNTHSHIISAGLDSSSGTSVTRNGGSTTLVASDGHTHPAGTGSTASVDNRPPFINVTFAVALSDISLPYSSWAGTGLIAMFNSTPPQGWDVVSSSGQPFFQRFLQGDDSYGGTGGANTHSHPNAQFNTGPPSSTESRRTGAGANAGDDQHTHLLTVSFDNVSHIPPYIDVIFAFASSDFEPPSITLDSPANDFITNDQNVIFNASISDNSGIANVSLFGNWTGSFSRNLTNSSGLDSVYEFNQELPDGTFVWAIQACDISNNCNVSENRTITIDSTDPVININSPNADNFSSSLINFNISLSEPADLAWYTLDNGINNISMSSTDNINWNATNSSIADGEYLVNFYANDSAGNTGTSSRVFGIDTINPSVIIFSPQPINYTTNSLLLNFSAVDSGLESCWYSDDGGITNNTLNSCQDIIYSALQGVTTLNVYANDSAGNLNDSEKVTFFVDSIAPSLSFVTPPTRPNGSFFGENYIPVKVTISEANFANITYELYNSTGLENRTIFNTPVTEFNWTGLSQSNIDYSYNVSVTDILGNSNSTETRTLTLTVLDLQPPVITINNPEFEGAGINESFLSFDITLDENGSSAWYTLDNGINNISMSSTDNINWNATNSSIVDGEYLVNFYANDSTGNVGNKTRGFTIDTIFPLIEYGQGTEISGANLSKSNIFANASVDEANFASLIFRLFNSTSLVNETIYTDSRRTINWTSLPDGQYSFNVSVMDIANNTNLTQTRTLVLDTAAPYGIQFVQPTLDSGANASQDYILLNVTANDINLMNITVNLYNSTSLINTSASFNSPAFFNFSNLQDGEYFFNATAFDYSSNSNSSETRSILLDNTNPIVSFITGTEPDGASMAANSIFVNVSITESNFANITYELYNSTGLENRTTYTNPVSTITWQGLQNNNKLYYYNVSVYDILGNFGSTPTRNITLIDIVPPSYTELNQTINNSKINKVYRGQEVNLSARWLDVTGMESAWLSTNQTGTWINWSGLYNSPQGLSGTDSISSFNWSNTTIIPGSVISWKIYANDTSGNENATAARNFELWGLSEISNSFMDPSGVDLMANATFYCEVTDSATSEPLADYNVSFYNSTGLIGSNLTDSNGLASIPIRTFFAGSFSYSCNITDYPEIFYDSSSDNQGSASLGVGFGSRIYNYNNLTFNTAFEGTSETTITEINDPYNDLVDDDDIFQDFQAGEGSFAFSRFEIKIDEPLNEVTMINLTWRGFGNTGSGTDGFILSVFNNSAGGYSQFASYNTDNAEQTRNLAYTNSFSDIVNSSGWIIILARSFSAAPSSGNPSNRFVDIATDQIEAEVRTDIIAPIVTLNSPASFINTSLTNVDFSCFVEDDNSISNVSLFGNWSSQGEHINQTNTSGINNVNYSFSAAPGEGNFIWNCLACDNAGNCGDSVLENTFTTDYTPPQVNLLYPIDHTNFSNLSIPEFNYSVSDLLYISNCSLYGNWSNGWHLNQSSSNPIDTGNFSGVDVEEEGFYIWNIECTDGAGNIGTNSTNFTFASFFFPNQTILSNITQSSNDGTGNITLSWDEVSNALSYKIYYADRIPGEFILLNETSMLNYTDTNFAGHTRRFYRVDSVNPTGQNASEDYFGAHVYTFMHNGNTRNWIGFPTRPSYMTTASQSLNEIINITALTTWNATRQERVTCNEFSCPSFPSCTDTNCNFNLESGKGYELNVDSDTDSPYNWSLTGITNRPMDIILIKNSTDFGKNWISLYAGTKLVNATSLIENITGADAITNWNAQMQTSQGLIPNPFGPGFIGNNFPIIIEKGYEVSVAQDVNWTQA